MSDIVTLGIKLDTTGVAAGIKVIGEGLPQAAKRAADAVDGLGKAATGLGGAAAKAAPGLAGATTATTGLTAATKPATQAVVAHAVAHKGLDAAAQAMGHSIRSGIEGIASGVPITTVLTQQFGHLSFAATGKTGLSGAFKDASGALLGLITPTTAVIGGVAALAATAAVMYSSWKSSTLVLDDTARAAGTTTKSLSALQAAAAFKGIDAAAFTKGIDGFSKSVYEAQHHMGSLAETFRANNVHASDFDDYMSKAAGLIKTAGSDQQRLVLLQQMGLPSTMEWVRLLSGGAEGLAKAKVASVEFAANDGLVANARRVDEAYNKAWTNFGLNARSAFQTALQSGTTLFDRMERLAVTAGNSSIWDRFLPSNHADIAKGMGITPISPFAQRFAGDSTNPAAGNTSLTDGLRAAADKRNKASTVDPAALSAQIQREQPYLGLFGEAPTAQAAANDEPKPANSNKDSANDRFNHRAAA